MLAPICAVSPDDGRLRPSLAWPYREGVTMRPAAAGEGPLLAAIERESPIVLGDVEVVYDRGAAD